MFQAINKYHNIMANVNTIEIMPFQIIFTSLAFKKLKNCIKALSRIQKNIENLFSFALPYFVVSIY